MQGLDLTGLTNAERTLFWSVANEQYSPCGDPHTLAACGAQSTCPACAPALRFLAHRVEDGFGPDTLGEMVRTRYDRAAVRQIDLTDAPMDRVAVRGLTTTARYGRATLAVAGLRYDAPVTFCDPWPFGFGLLGQEGFLRSFRVTLCAKEFWLEVEPEDD